MTVRAAAAAGVTALALLLAPLLGGCAASPLGGGAERGATGAPVSIQRLAKQIAASDAVLAALVPDDAPGCSAAVGRPGEPLWAGARGLADLAAGTQLTTSTRFEMASLAKQFTGALVLALVGDGLLDLDDPIGAHVPGLPAWGRTITVEQLLHHTARLPDFWIELEAEGIGFSDPADQQTVLAAIRRVEAPLEGSGYAYANSHYVLLAAAVESVTDEPFAAVMQTRVLDPLGIDARIEPGAVATGAAATDIAVGHDADGVPIVEAWTTVGAVGLVTTPTELVRWAAQFGSDGLMANAADGAVDSSEGLPEEAGERYGAGIQITADGTLFHAGRWGGSVSLLEISPDLDLAVAVACNRTGAPRVDLVDALRETWDHQA